MIIKQLDPIYCQTDQPEILKPILTFKKEFWRKEGFKKVRHEYPSFLIDKKGIFLAGFLPRIEEYLTSKNIKYEVACIDFTIPKASKPFLPKIKFREDQLNLINSAIDNSCGILKAPTGSGKTVVSAGLISCFADSKILFLCHTITLTKQTKDEFKKFFPKINITQIGDGEKNLSGQIVISTIQSFSKLNPEEYCDLFDIVIVDECHHGASNQYQKVLTNLLTPIRIGLTATLPSNEEQKLILEGLIGPVIGEMTLEEGKEKGILAKMKLKLIKIPYCSQIRDLKTYKDIYEAGICSYRTRNRMIIEEIEKLNLEGKSTITYVNKIEHGIRLLNMGINLDSGMTMIQGSTESEDRNQFRKDLQEKTIMNVVATTVWREGLNIPSVGAIILASGGKSEKELLQTIGRGLRRDIGKDEVLIIDFVDSGRYLAEHFVERLGIYLENKWI